jgi:hypothetical protein
MAEKKLLGLGERKLVGKPTKEKTKAGRTVYKTNKGERVSEKSRTIPIGDKWYNVPSIHAGKKYTEDELKTAIENNRLIPTSVHDNKEEAIDAAKKRSNKLYKGGTPMMNRQMDMFREGGLNQEGGMIDAESGNEVPVGSTREEVRDDIPAKLSEGEFVMPADVVRYHGLDKMMALRDEAKMGLRKMDAMGQMGNSDEATLPEEMPFGMADLIVVAEDGKEVEMAEGGYVTMANGGLTPNNNPLENTRNLGATYRPPTSQPIDFTKVMGDGGISFKQYRNANGENLLVSFIGGVPITPIPEGYTEYTPGADEPVTPIQEVVQLSPPTPVANDEDRQRAGYEEGYSIGIENMTPDQLIEENRRRTSVFGKLAGAIAFAINPAAGALYAFGVNRNKGKLLEAAKKNNMTDLASSIEKEKGLGGIVGGIIEASKNLIPESIKNSKVVKFITNIFNGEGSDPADIEEVTKTVKTERGNLGGIEPESNIINKIAQAESGGKDNAVNSLGYEGRLQFGTARLKDFTQATGKSTEGFLNNSALQREVEKWHVNDIENYIVNNKLDRFYGQNIAGVAVNKDAIIGMAHLGGNSGAKQFLETGGEYNPSDAYGTSLSDYGKKFSSAEVELTDIQKQLRSGYDKSQQARERGTLPYGPQVAGLGPVTNEQLRQYNQGFMTDGDRYAMTIGGRGLQGSRPEGFGDQNLGFTAQTPSSTFESNMRDRNMRPPAGAPKTYDAFGNETIFMGQGSSREDTGIPFDKDTRFVQDKLDQAASLDASNNPRPYNDPGAYTSTGPRDAPLKFSNEMESILQSGVQTPALPLKLNASDFNQDAMGQFSSGAITQAPSSIPAPTGFNFVETERDRVRAGQPIFDQRDTVTQESDRLRELGRQEEARRMQSDRGFTPTNIVGATPNDVFSTGSRGSSGLTSGPLSGDPFAPTRDAMGYIPPTPYDASFEREPAVSTNIQPTLAELAESSNVSAAGLNAGINLSSIQEAARAAKLERIIAEAGAKPRPDESMYGAGTENQLEINRRRALEEYNNTQNKYLTEKANNENMYGVGNFDLSNTSTSNTAENINPATSFMLPTNYRTAPTKQEEAYNRLVGSANAGMNYAESLAENREAMLGAEGTGVTPAESISRQQARNREDSLGGAAAGPNLTTDITDSQLDSGMGAALASGQSPVSLNAPSMDMNFDPARKTYDASFPREPAVPALRSKKQVALDRQKEFGLPVDPLAIDTRDTRSSAVKRDLDYKAKVKSKEFNTRGRDTLLRSGKVVGKNEPQAVYNREQEETGYIGTDAEGYGIGMIAGPGQAGVVVDSDGKALKVEGSRKTIYQDSKGQQYTKSTFGKRETLDGKAYKKGDAKIGDGYDKDTDPKTRGRQGDNEADSESSGKIICTAMNASYGFGSYRQAIWLNYSNKHLTKAHEVGYHTLFLPLVYLAYTKDIKFIRTLLEHGTRRRTADLRAELKGTKRNTLGRFYRTIFEPLCYTVGKIKIALGN